MISNFFLSPSGDSYHGMLDENRLSLQVFRQLKITGCIILFYCQFLIHSLKLHTYIVCILKEYEMERGE
jgi:hypothetical protein